MKDLRATTGLLLAMLAMLAGPATGWAQNTIDSRCTNPSDTACVDWEAGVAIAIGSGAPMANASNQAVRNQSALRAAKLDAYRNILELVRGLNLSSSSNMKDLMIENDTVRTEVEGRLHGVRQVGTPKYFSDGSIQVKIEARLTEVLPENLYAESGPPRQLEAPGMAPAGAGVDAGRVYTGLIIDARGTGVLPAISPKVLDPEGREIYGSAYVSREFVVSQGMAGYVKSVDAARQNDRVKGNPAVIKAVEARGANKADLVIAQPDADALRALSQTQTFLRESRVMIVLD